MSDITEMSAQLGSDAAYSEMIIEIAKKVKLGTELTQEESTIKQQLDELDRIDPFLRTEKMIESCFDLMKLGQIEPEEARFKIMLAIKTWRTKFVLDQNSDG